MVRCSYRLPLNQWWSVLSIVALNWTRLMSRARRSIYSDHFFTATANETAALLRLVFDIVERCESENILFVEWKRQLWAATVQIKEISFLTAAIRINAIKRFGQIILSFRKRQSVAGLHFHSEHWLAHAFSVCRLIAPLSSMRGNARRQSINQSILCSKKAAVKSITVPRILLFFSLTNRGQIRTEFPLFLALLGWSSAIVYMTAEVSVALLAFLDQPHMMSVNRAPHSLAE